MALTAVEITIRHSTPRWSLRQPDLASAPLARLRADPRLFLLVSSASFIESGSASYARNLVDYFSGDDDICGWLRDRWEPDELHHGRALKHYAQSVWPGFDWDAAYADFFAEYASLCTLDKLEATRGQELVARCIVEMGTTCYYQALHDATEEPALQDLASCIRSDEVQHYKYFLAFARRYIDRERLGRRHLIATIARRVVHLRSEDADIALRHAMAWAVRGAVPVITADAARQARSLVRAHFPISQAVRMTLQPLALRPALVRLLLPPLAGIGRAVLRP